jgi:hypothetical protein
VLSFPFFLFFSAILIVATFDMNFWLEQTYLAISQAIKESSRSNGALAERVAVGVRIVLVFQKGLGLCFLAF